MNAERRSYGAEKPLTPAVVLRRLQFGVVMERRAGEVTAKWVGQIPDLALQHSMSEYVVNELKHASILRKRIAELRGDPDALWNDPLPELKELWDYHASLGSFCELVASVQYGHEEFFPRTSFNPSILKLPRSIGILYSQMKRATNGLLLRYSGAMARIQRRSSDV
jgi:hypothetical protein